MSRQLEQTLKQVGAVLVRNKRHAIYRLPNGRTYVLSCTSSDYRRDLNAIKGLQRTAALPPMEGTCQH